MEEKRYTIVRVQKKCPYYEVISKKCLLDFEDCRKKCININGKFQYGDTKEQLVRKIAQALLIDQIERYRKAPNCDVNKTIVEHENRICLEKATKIVEFLGVK